MVIKQLMKHTCFKLSSKLKIGEVSINPNSIIPGNTWFASSTDVNVGTPLSEL